jgi:hypothetical protein
MSQAGGDIVVVHLLKQLESPATALKSLEVYLFMSNTVHNSIPTGSNLPSAIIVENNE